MSCVTVWLFNEVFVIDMILEAYLIGRESMYDTMLIWKSSLQLSIRDIIFTSVKAQVRLFVISQFPWNNSYQIKAFLTSINNTAIAPQLWWLEQVYEINCKRYRQKHWWRCLLHSCKGAIWGAGFQTVDWYLQCDVWLLHVLYFL